MNETPGGPGCKGGPFCVVAVSLQKREVAKRTPDLLDGLCTVVASNSQNKSGLRGCRFIEDNQVEREKITFWRVLSGIPTLQSLLNQGIQDNLFEQKKVIFHLERPANTSTQ
jgi:hypothetical protein